MYSALIVNFLLHPTFFCSQTSISNMSAVNTTEVFTRMGVSESSLLLNAADLLKSQEELIQVKHGDYIRLIEIYQGDKLTLARLNSGRWFLFGEYYVTCNSQDTPVFKDSHQNLLVLPVGYIESQMSPEDIAMYWVTMHNLSPLTGPYHYSKKTHCSTGHVTRIRVG